MKTKLKAMSPLIATILLVVVAVILVTVVLNWGKETITNNLDTVKNFGELKTSDATYYVFSEALNDGILKFTYSPPKNLQDKVITIKEYSVLELTDHFEPIPLKEDHILTPGTNIIELTDLYAHTTSTPDLTIQLITTDNTFLKFNVSEPGMVCLPGGDGSEEDPKIICTAEDLNAVREHLSGNYALGKDIDLYYFSRRDENGWDPIGKFGDPLNSNAFKGSLDGKNQSISNLYINRPEEYYVGLFEFCKDSIFKNIIVKDANVTSNLGGILFGSIYDSLIDSIHVTGTISGAYIGGVANYIYDSTGNGGIFNSSFNGSIFVKANYYVAGGIAYNISGGIVSNCYSAGSIISYDSCSDKIGGLFGGYYTFDDLIIENSYSIMNITDSSNPLVCSNSNIGGLAGALESDGGSITIINSYYAGKISGVIENFYIGGIIGYLYGEALIENSYWDINVSGQENSDGGVGKSTEDMKKQSTFTGWNFTTIWDISPSINNGYPYLRDNPPPN